MKMAMKDGMLRIIEADITQAAIIKSWGSMKYSRSNQMYELSLIHISEPTRH